jgi:hypothetical protein
MSESSPLKKIAAGMAIALVAGLAARGLTRAQAQGGGQPQGDVPFKIVTGCSALFHIRLNTPGILPARRT